MITHPARTDFTQQIAGKYVKRGLRLLLRHISTLLLLPLLAFSLVRPGPALRCERTRTCAVARRKVPGNSAPAQAALDAGGARLLCALRPDGAPVGPGLRHGPAVQPGARAVRAPAPARPQLRLTGGRKRRSASWPAACC